MCKLVKEIKKRKTFRKQRLVVLKSRKDAWPVGDIMIGLVKFLSLSKVQAIRTVAKHIVFRKGVLSSEFLGNFGS